MQKAKALAQCAAIKGQLLGHHMIDPHAHHRNGDKDAIITQDFFDEMRGR